MTCLECEAEIAELAQVCGRCGSRAPVEYQLFVAEDRAAGAAYDAAGGPASAAVQADVEQQRPESAPDQEADRAELAEWVQTQKFSTTRLRPGYDEEEVDTFLDAIQETFLGIREPSLTPVDLRMIQFPTTRLRPGYDEEEVDAFLDEAAVRLAAQTGARVLPARQPSTAADPAATQPGGRGGPSRLLLGFMAGLATAGVVVGLTRWRRWRWKRRGNL
jgi:DivIVA domain-containing protein